MSGFVRVRCPAKINLRLEVVGRRDDGYHELRTLFQAVEVEDVLEAYPAGERTLSTDLPSLGDGSDNLVLRAADRLARHVALDRAGARLRLHKAIPVGGGLGGGSSDAAGALVALCTLWGIGRGEADLAAIAREIGADVAFFLTGGTAYGSGRGDRVVAMPPLRETQVLLGTPPFGIPTPEVYRRIAAPTTPLTPPGAGVKVPALFHKLVAENDFGLVANDLEKVVLDGWPELREFRAALAEHGARAASVSGSGSTVFGLFEDAAHARRTRDALERRFPGWTVRATRTVPHGVRVERSGGNEAAWSGE